MPPPRISIPTSSHFRDSQTGNKISPAQVPGALKRKRPPTIEIPNVLSEISDHAQLATRQFAAVSSSGHGFAVSSVKGKKKFMEDIHKAISCSHGSKGFFGVYDGHGGRKAAEFVEENLHTNIFEMIEYCTDDMAKEEAVKAGYLKTDREFLKQGLGSGACCLTTLIEQNEIVVSNLGDCRAVLCRDGVAVALTKDHTAEQEDERKRIESQGGYVEMHRGAWRVHGVLSVSRSIGDAHLKEWILAEPDTKILKLTPDMEYLILASDGLWKEVGNQEAVDIVSRLCLIKKEMTSIGDHQIKNNPPFSFSSKTPSPMAKKILQVKRKKTGQCLSQKYGQNEFASENENSPRCLSEKEVAPAFRGNHEDIALGFSSRCPSPMSKRVSLVKQKNDFADENEGPPLKTRKVSLQMNGFSCENEDPGLETRKVPILQENVLKSPSPKEGFGGYKKRPASGGLVAACDELVSLAARRGSLDDITVMIVDLNHFKTRPNLSQV